jgi:hypothetical protein
MRSSEAWVWPALVFLILAALGALAAVVVARGGETETVVATRVRLVHVVRRPVQTTQLVPTLPIVTTASTPTPSGSTPNSGLTAWPEADGYTVVLESVPAADGAAAARQSARRALAKGLSQVGVIDSKEFSSLAPGYLVVFTGVFDSAASAADHIADARGAGFHSAYERQIAR